MPDLYFKINIRFSSDINGIKRKKYTLAFFLFVSFRFSYTEFVTKISISFFKCLRHQVLFMSYFSFIAKVVSGEEEKAPPTLEVATNTL